MDRLIKGGIFSWLTLIAVLFTSASIAFWWYIITL